MTTYNPSIDLTDEEHAAVMRLGRLAINLVGEVPEGEHLDSAGRRALLERNRDAVAVMMSASHMGELLQMKHRLSRAAVRRAVERNTDIPDRNIKVYARRAELLAAGKPGHTIVGQLMKEFNRSRRQIGRILEK